MRTSSVLSLILALLALFAVSGGAQERIADLTLAQDPRDYVGYDQKLGAQLPADLAFLDHDGKRVRLVDYAQDRPMILALVYYSCPRLCTEVLNGSVRMLRAMESLELGEDYQFVVVSIDPKETPEIAFRKRESYLEALGVAARPAGWHFLTGDQESVTRLAKTVGFRYVWDERAEQFAHDGGLVVINTKHEVSRYFFGMEYSALDVRLALVEAGKGKIGSLVDHVLLLCMHYDPLKGTYGFWIFGAVRIAGVATVLLLGSYMLRSFLRDRRAARPAVQGA